MKRALVLISVGAALTVALSFASADQFAPRPPDVAPDSWISLNADAGFVVTESISQMTKQGEKPALSGYLMARHDGKWLRLEVEGGGRFLEAK